MGHHIWSRLPVLFVARGTADLRRLRLCQRRQESDGRRSQHLRCHVSQRPRSVRDRRSIRLAEPCFLSRRRHRQTASPSVRGRAIPGFPSGKRPGRYLQCLRRIDRSRQNRNVGNARGQVGRNLRLVRAESADLLRRGHRPYLPRYIPPHCYPGSCIHVSLRRAQLYGRQETAGSPLVRFATRSLRRGRRGGNLRLGGTQVQGTEEEEAALTLGASGWQTFLAVSLPNVKWGLLYGVILCNARAMGEFGAVSVVSGHIRGMTNTMPLHIEILYNEYEYVAAFAVASLRSQGHWRKSPSSQNQAHQLDWSSCQGGSDHPMGGPCSRRAFAGQVSSSPPQER